MYLAVAVAVLLSDGVAEQVLTCQPTVNEANPSRPSGSDSLAGSVPT